MKKEKMAYAQKLGWFFIVISLLCLAYIIPRTIYWSQLEPVMRQSPESVGNFLSIFFPLFIFSEILFLAYFFAGIGMVRLKMWSYELALFVPFFILLDILRAVWFMGFQWIMRPSFFFSATITVLFFALLIRKQVVQSFSADHLARKGKALDPIAYRNKLLRQNFIFVGSMIVLALCVWFVILHTTFGDKLPLMKIKPQQVEYQIQDHDFITRECEKREIFDYSIAIPRGLNIHSVGMIDVFDTDRFSFSIHFLQEQGSDKIFMIFDSFNPRERFFSLAQVFNLKSAYDLERKLFYPNWSPIYFILKSALTLPRGLVSIDEVTASSWKGFVTIFGSREERVSVYLGSVYNTVSDQGSSFLVWLKSLLTPQQVKSILASLEFSVSDQDSASLFKKGQQALSQKDHTTATIHFMNAFYRDQRNMQYAYFLARSLYEDSADTGRSGRLKSAKDFLEFVLKSEPENSQAQVLLPAVMREIESEEAKKMDEVKRQEER